MIKSIQVTAWYLGLILTFAIVAGSFWVVGFLQPKDVSTAPLSAIASIVPIDYVQVAATTADNSTSRLISMVQVFAQLLPLLAPAVCVALILLLIGYTRFRGPNHSAT